MKRLLIITLCVFPSFALALEADSWFKPVPESLRDSIPNESIPAEWFFEVSASKEGTAEFWLADKSALPLGQDSPSYLGQHNFKCPSSTKAYLIRAVYQNGGTGAFAINKYQTALLVSHGSLGAPSRMQRTGLVVCLDFEPTNVYHSLSGAM